MSSPGPASQLNSALVQAVTLCQVFFPSLLKYVVKHKSANLYAVEKLETALNII